MSKIAQIYYYDPQSAKINLQSPKSDSTPWTLTLVFGVCLDAPQHQQPRNRKKELNRIQFDHLSVAISQMWVKHPKYEKASMKITNLICALGLLVTPIAGLINLQEKEHRSIEGKKFDNLIMSCNNCWVELVWANFLKFILAGQNFRFFLV